MLAGVEAQQLSAPTPCASWKVRELINHVVGGTTFFAVTAETGVAPTGDGAIDFCEGDFVTEFNKGAARAVKAFEADGVMDKTLRLPFGELPGGVFVNIATGDTFTHGWDLARATGQPTDLDPELASTLLAFAEAFLSTRCADPTALRRSAHGKRPRRARSGRPAGSVHGPPGLSSRSKGPPGLVEQGVEDRRAPLQP